MTRAGDGFLRRIVDPACEWVFRNEGDIFIFLAVVVAGFLVWMLEGVLR
jgi:hypothetical protein